MPVNSIVDRQLASEAFAIINETIDVVNLHTAEIAELKVSSKRTITNFAPAGVPVDGEEWIIV